MKVTLKVAHTDITVLEDVVLHGINVLHTAQTDTLGHCAHAARWLLVDLHSKVAMMHHAGWVTEHKLRCNAAQTHALLAAINHLRGTDYHDTYAQNVVGTWARTLNKAVGIDWYTGSFTGPHK